MKKVSVVIPSYNEAGNICKMLEHLQQVFQALPYAYEVIFVDDGSSDGTAQLLQYIHQRDNRIQYIQLSRNFGHQNALKAGLTLASGDCVISMDADLQHPPALLPEFLQKWEEGYDIVYSIREDDRTNSSLKRKTSAWFYKAINSLSDIDLDAGAADFRLIDRKVADVFKELNEHEPFMRGLFKWIGFTQYAIRYTPAQRYSGKSKYTLKKMLRLAVQGITSFSIKPLYMAVYLGFGFSAVSVAYIPYVVYTLIQGQDVPGWASVLMTIVFFGGLQLTILGIIGIYIGKLFLQAKQRPNYIVQQTSLTGQPPALPPSFEFPKEMQQILEKVFGQTKP